MQHIQIRRYDFPFSLRNLEIMERNLCWPTAGWYQLIGQAEQGSKPVNEKWPAGQGCLHWDGPVDPSLAV